MLENKAHLHANTEPHRTWYIKLYFFSCFTFFRR